MVKKYLCKMTKSLDPDPFEDMEPFAVYRYCDADVDARWKRQQEPGRIQQC